MTRREPLLLLAFQLLLRTVSSSPCVVTSWSDWSPCYGNCEFAWKVRNRDVLESPYPEQGSDGKFFIQACPGLYQVLPCHPSYCDPSTSKNLGYGALNASNTQILRFGFAKFEDGSTEPSLNPNPAVESSQGTWESNLPEFGNLVAGENVDFSQLKADENDQVIVLSGRNMHDQSDPIVIVNQPEPAIVELPVDRDEFSLDRQSPARPPQVHPSISSVQQPARGNLGPSSRSNSYYGMVPEIVLSPKNLTGAAQQSDSNTWKPVWALVWTPVSEDAAADADEEAVLFDKLSKLVDDGAYKVFQVPMRKSSSFGKLDFSNPKINEALAKIEEFGEESLIEEAASMLAAFDRAKQNGKEYSEDEQAKALSKISMDRLLEYNPIWTLLWTLPVNRTEVNLTTHLIQEIMENLDMSGLPIDSTIVELRQNFSSIFQKSVRAAVETTVVQEQQGRRSASPGGTFSVIAGPPKQKAEALRNVEVATELAPNDIAEPSEPAVSRIRGPQGQVPGQIPSVPSPPISSGIPSSNREIHQGSPAPPVAVQPPSLPPGLDLSLLSSPAPSIASPANRVIEGPPVLTEDKVEEIPSTENSPSLKDSENAQSKERKDSDPSIPGTGGSRWVSFDHNWGTSALPIEPEEGWEEKFTSQTESADTSVHSGVDALGTTEYEPETTSLPEYPETDDTENFEGEATDTQTFEAPEDLEASDIEGDGPPDGSSVPPEYDTPSDPIMAGIPETASHSTEFQTQPQINSINEPNPPGLNDPDRIVDDSVPKSFDDSSSLSEPTKSNDAGEPDPQFSTAPGIPMQEQEPVSTDKTFSQLESTEEMPNVASGGEEIESNLNLSSTSPGNRTNSVHLLIPGSAAHNLGIPESAAASDGRDSLVVPKTDSLTPVLGGRDYENGRLPAAVVQSLLSTRAASPASSESVNKLVETNRETDFKIDEDWKSQAFDEQPEQIGVPVPEPTTDYDSLIGYDFDASFVGLQNTSEPISYPEPSVLDSQGALQEEIPFEEPNHDDTTSNSETEPLIADSDSDTTTNEFMSDEEVPTFTDSTYLENPTGAAEEIAEPDWWTATDTAAGETLDSEILSVDPVAIENIAPESDVSYEDQGVPEPLPNSGLVSKSNEYLNQAERTSDIMSPAWNSSPDIAAHAEGSPVSGEAKERSAEAKSSQPIPEPETIQSSAAPDLNFGKESNSEPVVAAVDPSISTQSDWEDSNDEITMPPKDLLPILSENSETAGELSRNDTDTEAVINEPREIIQAPIARIWRTDTLGPTVKFSSPEPEKDADQSYTENFPSSDDPDPEPDASTTESTEILPQTTQSSVPETEYIGAESRAAVLIEEDQLPIQKADIERKVIEEKQIQPNPEPETGYETKANESLKSQEYDDYEDFKSSSGEEGVKSYYDTEPKRSAKLGVSEESAVRPPGAYAHQLPIERDYENYPEKSKTSYIENPSDGSSIAEPEPTPERNKEESMGESPLTQPILTVAEPWNAKPRPTITERPPIGTTERAASTTYPPPSDPFPWMDEEEEERRDPLEDLLPMIPPLRTDNNRAKWDSFSAETAERAITMPPLERTIPRAAVVSETHEIIQAPASRIWRTETLGPQTTASSSRSQDNQFFVWPEHFPKVIKNHRPESAEEHLEPEDIRLVNSLLSTTSEPEPTEPAQRPRAFARIQHRSNPRGRDSADYAASNEDSYYQYEEPAGKSNGAGEVDAEIEEDRAQFPVTHEPTWYESDLWTDLPEIPWADYDDTDDLRFLHSDEIKSREKSSLSEAASIQDNFSTQRSSTPLKERSDISDQETETRPIGERIREDGAEREPVRPSQPKLYRTNVVQEVRKPGVVNRWTESRIIPQSRRMTGARRDYKPISRSPEDFAVTESSLPEGIESLLWEDFGSKELNREPVTLPQPKMPSWHEMEKEESFEELGTKVGPTGVTERQSIVQKDSQNSRSVKNSDRPSKASSRPNESGSRNSINRISTMGPRNSRRRASTFGTARRGARVSQTVHRNRTTSERRTTSNRKMPWNHRRNLRPRGSRVNKAPRPVRREYQSEEDLFEAVDFDPADDVEPKSEELSWKQPSNLPVIADKPSERRANGPIHSRKSESRRRRRPEPKPLSPALTTSAPILKPQTRRAPAWKPIWSLIDTHPGIQESVNFAQWLNRARRTTHDWRSFDVRKVTQPLTTTTPPTTTTTTTTTAPPTTTKGDWVPVWGDSYDDGSDDSDSSDDEEIGRSDYQETGSHSNNFYDDSYDSYEYHLESTSPEERRHKKFYW